MPICAMHVVEHRSADELRNAGSWINVSVGAPRVTLHGPPAGILLPSYRKKERQGTTKIVAVADKGKLWDLAA
jgi:hypothetical protein